MKRPDSTFACLKFLSAKTVVATLALACPGFWSLPATAQQVQHLTITQPGGMPGLPVMTAIIPLTNGVQLTWAGPAGYYQVFQKSNSLMVPWTALGKSTNLAWTATITKLYS